LGVACLVMLVLAILQYGPIAEDQRREKAAVQMSLHGGSVQPLAEYDKEQKGRQEGRPNNSQTLLVCSVLAEFFVIIIL
jgi:hypothetical protein